MSEPEPEPFEVWPENRAALELFLASATQWRQSFGGPTGLDYTAVEALMRMHRVPRAERPDRLAELRIMEAAALAIWRERSTNGKPS